ncbi:MAG: elongation factor G [Bacteroidetes bacterium]|nr:elongation factor G [Bacteroidota bacterium]MBU1678989.1 elongation factor G [Bacteroidota bacterium]MBU2506008.1 elongation factor G [Bacteroidota bacterium]
MKDYNPDAIRNLAFIGHGGSGKTTLTENILFKTGEINRIGSVEEGNTVSDFNSNEVERSISISASLLHCEWKNKKINFLDTPGYTDFIGQVISSLHVVDTAVCVIKSAEGIEVGTETTWDYVKKNNLPAAVIINKIDNEHSKFEETIESAKNRLSSDITVISFPSAEGINFNSVIDIIKMKEITFAGVESKDVFESEISDAYKAKAAEMREQLIEKIAESDEALMNKFFEEGTLNDADLESGIKSAILTGSLVPAFAVSATMAVGIQNFLDFVITYFPSPVDRPAAKGSLNDKPIEIKCDPKGDPALLIFKSLSEQHVGELSIFKVYSGEFSAGMDLINPKKGKSERLAQLFVMNGKNRKEVTKIVAGDIGAVVKLKDSHATDTLSTKDNPIIVEPFEIIKPSIRGAIKPKAKGDEDKISSGLHTVHQEDPTLTVQFDPELGQTIVSGQGELQLSLAVKLLKDRYNVEVELVEPRVPYREAIKGRCDDAEFKHKKQSGGRGQYGHVHLKLEPQPRGTGFEFVDAIVGGVVPGRFIPAVEKGLNEILNKGILTGSKVVDVKVTLFDGTYHNVDSDEVSFKIAASQAFKKGFLAANPVLLEPIYDITVKVPEEFMGDVMGDISSRRGKIQGMDSEGPFQIIKAKVPLAELYKYSTHLRSLTSGRGGHQRNFSHYEEVPKEFENKVIEEYQKSKEED